MKKSLLILAFALLWLWNGPLDAQTKRKVVFGVPVTPPNVVHIPPYIAKEMRFFAENNIDVEFATFEGGTFLVSNLGMLVIDSFIAIINPPNAPS